MTQYDRLQGVALRIRIVGTSGSGKSHLATRAAERTGALRLELDGVFWGADWTLRDPRAAFAEIASFTATNADWIIDGNWDSKLGDLLAPGTDGGATAVVWLDLPRRTVMRRVIARTLRRGILRQELWHGNRERLSNLLRWDPERNIVRWAWTSHANVRRRMLRAVDAGLPVVRLRTRRDIDSWLGSLPAPGARGGRSVEG